MIRARTMGDVWREQRQGLTKPKPAKEVFSRWNAADVLAQRLKVLTSDIAELQSAVTESLPGALAMMATLEQQLRTLKGT